MGKGKWFNEGEWDRLKLAFGRLPADMKRHYESIAENSRNVARSNMKVASDAQRSLDALKASNKYYSRVAPLAQNQNPDPGMCVLNFNAISASEQLHDLPDDLDVLRTRLAAACTLQAKGFTNDPMNSKFAQSPLAVSEIDTTLLAAHSSGKPINQTLKKFKLSAQHVADVSTDAAAEISRTVHYRQGCGSMCRITSSCDAVACHDGLLSLLHSVMCHFKKGAELVQSDPTVVVRLTYTDPLSFGGLMDEFTYLHFSMISAPSAASGIHAQKQVHHFLEPVDGEVDPDSSLDGVILRLSTEPLVVPERRFMEPLASHAGKHGALECLDSHDYAVYLLNGHVRGKPHKHNNSPAGLLPSRISMETLSFRDIDRHTIAITGTARAEDATFDRVWNTVVGEPLPGASHKKNSAGATNKRCAHDLNPLTSDFDPDFGLGQSKSRRSEGPSTATADHDNHGTHLSMLDFSAVGSAISEVIAETLDLDALDDSLELPINELRFSCGDDLVDALRAQAKAELEKTDLTVGSDSDCGSGDDPEATTSSKAGKKNPKSVAAKGKATAKAKAQAKSKSKSAEGTSSAPSATRLFTLLQNAERDTLIALAPDGSWATQRIAVSNSSGSSDPQPLDQNVGELSVASTYPKLSVKMTCLIHRQCSCWVNVNADQAGLEDVREALMNWMTTARSLDASYHALHSEQVRESFGVRPRKPIACKKS